MKAQPTTAAASAATPTINRRNFLTRAAGVTAAIGLPAGGALAAPQMTEIERLFAEWQLLGVGPFPATEQGDAAFYARYRDLQDRIILDCEPQTMRDLAIQMFVDTDEFGSDNSVDFEERIAAIVGTSPKAVPLRTPEQRYAAARAEFVAATKAMNPEITDWRTCAYDDDEHRGILPMFMIVGHPSKKRGGGSV